MILLYLLFKKCTFGVHSSFRHLRSQIKIWGLVKIRRSGEETWKDIDKLDKPFKKVYITCMCWSNQNKWNLCLKHIQINYKKADSNGFAVDDHFTENSCMLSIQSHHPDTNCIFPFLFALRKSRFKRNYNMRIVKDNGLTLTRLWEAEIRT